MSIKPCFVQQTIPQTPQISLQSFKTEKTANPQIGEDETNTCLAFLLEKLLKQLIECENDWQSFDQ